MLNSFSDVRLGRVESGLGNCSFHIDHKKKSEFFKIALCGRKLFFNPNKVCLKSIFKGYACCSKKNTFYRELLANKVCVVPPNPTLPRWVQTDPRSLSPGGCSLHQGWAFTLVILGKKEQFWENRSFWEWIALFSLFDQRAITLVATQEIATSSFFAL